MTNPLTVAILAGGLTHEREVSLHSGRRMTALLREAGMQVKMLDVDGGLLGTLKAMSPDIVWPLVHGSTGEDGSLQDLLSLIGIPFIGSRAGACRIASDKAVASAVLATSGIAVPAAISLPQALFREVGVGPILDLVEKRFGFPLVVKPAQGGSALGLTIVEHAGALPGAMVDCYAYGDEARIEVYYAGTEVAVSVIDVGNGPEALPPVEIVTDGPYDYDARYNAGRAEYFTPARLDGELLASVKETALRVYELLGLRHLSRIDIIVQSDGTVRVLDINVAPGMTETSLFPQAVQAEATAQGIDASDYYVKLVESASTN